MSDYVISCCSTADLSKEHFVQRNISYVCFHYCMDDVHYLDALGASMAFDDFYRAMQQGVDTRTSHITAAQLAAHFEGFL